MPVSNPVSESGGAPASAAAMFDSPGSDFDPKDLQSAPGLKTSFTSWLLSNLPVVLRLMRRFWPIAPIPFAGLTFVTRYDDVQEVLANDKAFPVPFGDKVKELNDGPNFVLGMESGPDYWLYQRQVMRAFRREDIADIVTPMAESYSREIVEGSNGRLDAIEGLITLVPTRISEDYYGIVLRPEQRVPFSQWTFAMSMYMFADPFNDPKLKPPALAGGRAVRAVVDASIAAARSASLGGDTVARRLLAMQANDADGPSDEIIRTYLVGMIAGFVPTNTMAAGNIIDVLLQRPAFLATAREAARDGDDERLRRCLFEASRFKPINPGPFRVCGADATVALGTSRAKRFKTGDILLVSTQSAMFDERRVADPWAFDPDRPPTDYMLFGHGLHWCLGAFIAQAQITQTLKQLLLRKNLRRAAGPSGKLQHLGSFPQHLMVEFDP
jgi:cytochrome P450